MGNKLIKEMLFFAERLTQCASHTHTADGGSAIVRVKLPSCSYFCGEGVQEAPGEPRPGSVLFCFKNLSIQFFY